MGLLLLDFPAMGYCGDTEMKVPSVENRDLTNILPVKHGVAQHIARHASPTARNVLLVYLPGPFAFFCFL